MNTKGREFGMAATRFANAHGLPDALQRTNCEGHGPSDRAALHDYPAARTLLGGQTFVYRAGLFAGTFRSSTIRSAFRRSDRLTQEAGYNLAVAAWRGGQEFVMIVLGSRSRAQSSSTPSASCGSASWRPVSIRRARAARRRGPVRVRRAAQATP